MRRRTRIMAVFCITLLLTTVLDICQIGDFGRNKEVRAVSEVYHDIEIDGVVWEYAIVMANIRQNKKTLDSDTGDLTSCVKVKLDNANGYTDITIPDTIAGYPVYGIEKGSSIDCDKIISLAMPITIEWIGTQTFYGWSSLKEVKFFDRGRLNSTGKEISEKEMYLYHIGDEAFLGCTSLTDIPIKDTIFSEKEDADIGEGIYRNCKGLKQVSISSTREKAYIPEYTFENCNLEDGIQVAGNIKELTIGNYAFRSCEIKKLEISCNCLLGQEAFSGNKNLEYAEFQGNVQSIGEKIFKGGFSLNENTKLVFAGEETELGRYALADSFVDTISFSHSNGNVSLGYSCILDSLVENIEFKNKNVVVKEGGLEGRSENLTKILFENSDTVCLSDGAFYSHLSFCNNKSYSYMKEIEFQCKNVVYTELSGLLTQDLEKSMVRENTKIIYGSKVEQVSGTLGVFLSKFSAVYIENPMMIHEAEFTISKPKIYGYTRHKEINGVFERIQKNGLILTYEEQEIVNTKGLEPDKLHVYTVLKTGNQIEIPVGKIVEEEVIDPQEEEGYLIQYGENLQNFEGTMPIYVYYQDTWDIIEIPIVSRKVTKIQAEWSKDYGNGLIEGQRIDLNQLVEKVKVYYNDGSCEEEDSEVLELLSEKVTKEDNIVTVCLKGNKEIKDSLQCEVRENKIERVIASYSDKEVFLGDKIDMDKISLKAVYTLEDESLDTQLPCKKISKTVFDLEGKNIIRVYYTDDLYSDMEVQVKKAKTIKVEAAYNEEYPCYGVNEEIDKDAIEVFVTLENQKVLTNSQLEYAYMVNIISYTENAITATITYDGVESGEFIIPLMKNKIIGISPILCKDSVLEGSLVGKELISYLRISYENGTSQIVSLDELDQSQLQVSEGYLATARQWNTITITYMGVSCKVDVWGEEDSVIAISVQYLGGDIEVGNSVSPTDCKVYLVKKSGKKVRVTDGIVIVNPVITTVGETLVFVCYDVFQGTIKVNGVNHGMQSDNSQSSTGEGETVKQTSACFVTSNYSKIKACKKVDYSVHINKTVKIALQTMNISNVQYQFVIKGKKVDDKKWKNVKNNSIIIKNTKEKYGILYIRYTLPGGIVKTIHTTGFCIDTTVPKTNIEKNRYYKKGKKLTFSDSHGVKWAKLDGKKIKSGIKVNKTGKHTLIVMDRAGNKISTSFFIR